MKIRVLCYYFSPIQNPNKMTKHLYLNKDLIEWVLFFRETDAENALKLLFLYQNLRIQAGRAGNNCPSKVRLQLQLEEIT